MASFTLEDGPVYDVIPAETLLEAEIIDCKTQPGPFWVDKEDHSKGKQDQVSFKFKVLTPGQYEGQIVFGNTPPWFNKSPKCTLRIWVQEILGFDELPDEFTFDTDDLVEQRCQIVIGNYVKKGKTEADDETKHFVEDVIRLDDDLVDANDVF
jgi:hypothetical protein